MYSLVLRKIGNNKTKKRIKERTKERNRKTSLFLSTKHIYYAKFLIYLSKQRSLKLKKKKIKEKKKKEEV